jgi:hypothetical protein
MRWRGPLSLSPIELLVRNYEMLNKPPQSAEFDLLGIHCIEPMQVSHRPPVNGIGPLVATAMTSGDDECLGFPELAQSGVFWTDSHDRWSAGRRYIRPLRQLAAVPVQSEDRSFVLRLLHGMGYRAERVSSSRHLAGGAPGFTCRKGLRIWIDHGSTVGIVSVGRVLDPCHGARYNRGLC